MCFFRSNNQSSSISSVNENQNDTIRGGLRSDLRSSLRDTTALKPFMANASVAFSDEDGRLIDRH